MFEPIAFTLASLALLATPGPTNTLLATSGAAAGFKNSIHLIGAEMLGYLVSITVLSLVLGPLVQASHLFSLLLRVGCALFLFYSAWRLWSEGGIAITSGKPVSFRRVLIATLLNPKGAVFAFIIVPYLTLPTTPRAVPYMAELMVLIAAAGGAWIAVGAAVRASGRSAIKAGYARRAGALVLCVFATVISASAFSA